MKHVPPEHLLPAWHCAGCKPWGTALRDLTQPGSPVNRFLPIVGNVQLLEERNMEEGVGRSGGFRKSETQKAEGGRTGARGVE